MSEIVQAIFKDEFKGYEHPFERADAYILRLDKGAKKMYYEEINGIIRLESFKNEIREWKRGLMEHLAMETQTEVEKAAYRLTLLQIKAFEQRLLSLASQLRAVKIGDAAKDI